VKEVKPILEREAQFRGKNEIKPYRAAVPGSPAVAAVTEQVPAKDWANESASNATPPRSNQGTTVQMLTESQGKGITGKSKDVVSRQSFRTNEPVTSFNNRAGAFKALGLGVGAGFFGNALKNLNYWGTPWAPTKMPVSFEESGQPTDSSVAKMDADAANAARR
jgi:hypothetical protein